MNDSPLDINYKAGEALIAALKHRDEYTQHHCLRVGDIARKTGQALHWADSEIKQLEMAALLHDIGKIGIPDRVLMFPGELSHDDYELMKSHSSIGANIVEKLDIPHADGVAEMILHHHENYDGSGYPHRLKGEAIPAGSRIISIIDVFDALTSTRVYRTPLTHTQALDKMHQHMHHQFDPKFLSLTSQVIAEHS